MDLCVYVCAEACELECSCPWRTEEGVELFGSGVTNHCELPYLGAGNQTQVL